MKRAEDLLFRADMAVCDRPLESACRVDAEQRETTRQ